MAPPIVRWLLAAAFAGLAGCASYDGRGLRPGIDGEPQIQALMGPPYARWSNADGGSTWEYPRGPYGRETFFVRIGPDGRLRGIEQVLNEANFARMEVGKTTMADVRHLIGRPDSEAYYARRDERDWLYRYRSGSILMKLYVTFDNRGVVKEVAEMLDEFVMPGFD